VTPADAPIQIVVELREGQVVAGLSESVEDIFEPSDTLGESEPFAAATDALGSDYAAILLLRFEPVLELFESTGAADTEPDYQAAKPYLDHLDYLITGSRRDGNRAVMRFVLGLK
jgi:hypothetical protein